MSTTFPMTKSLATNLVAAAILGAGLVSPVLSRELFNVGIFALSGAITNWIAIHMLFEKVPLLYGSGVIPTRFEEFKAGIHDLVMTQFFTIENLRRFLGSEHARIDPEPIAEAVDLDEVFAGLVDVIKQSSFGGMLALVGGEKGLEPLKAPFAERMRSLIVVTVESEQFQDAWREQLVSGHDGGLLLQVDAIVTQRLDELTPGMVKEIVQEMIRRHLGWLVVWGGVFGGLIGLLASGWR